MAAVIDIRDYFEERVPSSLKLDFDNVGFLAGESEREVTKALVTLDITDEVIEEAVELGAQLILSHHPLIFGAIKNVTDLDRTGRKLIRLIRNGMSAICLHTNLDAAKGGVNDALMAALGGTVTGVLNEREPISRMGMLAAPVSMESFLQHTKTALQANGLRYHDAGRPVFRLGCCGGSGGGDMELAHALGCDTYVTADVKYDTFLAAKELDINLIDADHFCTENVVVPVLAKMLAEGFPELEIQISQRHCQTARFF